MKTVAIFGGTFDPIHRGHLQSALELKRRFAFDELRMMPAGLPPHRESPGCSGEQRLAMVQLACDGTELVVDDREIRRNGPSYTIETLEQLRTELGTQVSLIWVMGADAFAGLAGWHRWNELLDVANLLVIARPGISLPQRGAIAELLVQHANDSAAQLSVLSRGLLVRCELTPHDISATAIRRTVAAGAGAAVLLETLVPAPVARYIEQHRLYL